jgi:hypothetical protein
MPIYYLSVGDSGTDTSPVYGLQIKIWVLKNGHRRRNYDWWRRVHNNHHLDLANPRLSRK